MDGGLVGWRADWLAGLLVSWLQQSKQFEKQIVYKLPGMT